MKDTACNYAKRKALAEWYSGTTTPVLSVIRCWDLVTVAYCGISMYLCHGEMVSCMVILLLVISDHIFAVQKTESSNERDFGL